MSKILLFVTLGLSIPSFAGDMDQGTDIAPSFSSVTITNLAVGGVLFSSTPDAGRISVDSSNLFWDDTENRLGVGVSTPATTLDVSGIAQFGGGSTKSTFTVAGALNLATALSVGNGGTGVTSLVSGGVLFGGSPITASAVLSNGQLLIGDGTTAPTLATLTGTTAEVDITNGAGTSTVGLTDSIIVASTLTVQGNAFSVGTSTLVVTGGNVGIGNATPTTRLHMSSGTLTVDGDVGNVRIGPSAVNAAGTLIVRSTSTTATNPVLNVQDNAGAIVLRVNQNGVMTNAGVVNISQDGASGAPAINFNGRNVGLRVSSNQLIFEVNGQADANTVMANQTGLGIGTFVPTSKLHISSGTLAIDGNTQLTLNFNGTFQPGTRTVTQIDSLTASAVGQYIHCSNCTLPGLCVSTGTAAAQWRKIESSTLGCGSGN